MSIAADVGLRYDGPFKVVPIPQKSQYRPEFEWAVIITSTPGKVCPWTGFTVWLGQDEASAQKFYDDVTTIVARRLMTQGTAAEGL